MRERGNTPAPTRAHTHLCVAAGIIVFIAIAGAAAPVLMLVARGVTGDDDNGRRVAPVLMLVARGVKGDDVNGRRVAGGGGHFCTSQALRGKKSTRRQQKRTSGQRRKENARLAKAGAHAYLAGTRRGKWCVVPGVVWRRVPSFLRFLRLIFLRLLRLRCAERCRSPPAAQTKKDCRPPAQFLLPTSRTRCVCCCRLHRLFFQCKTSLSMRRLCPSEPYPSREVPPVAFLPFPRHGGKKFRQGDSAFRARQFHRAQKGILQKCLFSAPPERMESTPEENEKLIIP